MDRHEIKDFLLHNFKSFNGIYQILKNKYPFIFDNIIQETKYLDDKCNNFLERIYHIIYDIHSLQTCKLCENPVTFLSFKDGYRTYCNSGCIYKDLEPKEKRKKTNQDRYGGNAPLSSKVILNKCKNTLNNRYGVDNVSKLDDVKNKKREKSLENYGTEYVFQSEEVKSSIRRTNLKKFGVDNPNKSEIVKQNTKNNCLLNHNVEYITQTDSWKQAVRESVLLKYGVPNVNMLDFVKEKKKETFMKNYNKPHFMKDEFKKNELRNIFLERYGVDNPMKYQLFKDKLQNTLIKRYGTTNLFSIPEFNYKFHQTLYKNYGVYSLNELNNTVSKPQLELFKICQTILPYPVLEYYCSGKFIDIAIPKLGVAIEYDGSYWHQDDESDMKRQKLLENEGWTFLRYIDYVPNEDVLLNDINQILVNNI